MTKLSAWKKACAVFLLCAAMSIAAPAQTLTTLVDFDGTNGDGPQATLIQGHDGNLYGTTFAGGGDLDCGANGCGTIFKITLNGTLTTLYTFCAQPNCADGSAPYAGLVLATDGNFYGTTYQGGDLACGQGAGCGTLFKITPSGTLTTLHSFDGIDGNSPEGGLIQAADGSFYGTTALGGDTICFEGCGTVFKITPSGALTTLHSFDGIDGNSPEGGLIQAADGNFYGTTALGGGSLGYGTVFKMTPAGTLMTLSDFDDGAQPRAGLVEGTDGNFYGTTYYGGFDSFGTVFKVTPGGTLTTLYDFCRDGCTSGDSPTAALVQATDGNFYGTAHLGGTGESGTAFKITPTGELTTLYSFCDCADGGFPFGGLVQATNGTFYGTTQHSGNDTCGFNGCGTVFSLDMGLGPFVTFVRASGRVGRTGPILGQGFTGTTSVSLNGILASFTVISDTLIRATVPVGGTTGYVTVTTPSGTLTSNVPFHVIK
jgi:uncharacterized repeat protein (TIGR03803 family)